MRLFIARFSLLLLFLLFELPNFAQVSGTYCFGTGFTCECFNFVNDSVFEYQRSSCLKARKGTGVYSVANNRLLLKFENDTARNRSHVQNLEFFESQGDSVSMIFRVKSSEDSLELSYSTVLLKNDVGQLVVGCLTDEKGEGKLKLLKTNDTLKLEISSWGYEPIEQQFACNQNVEIDVMLKTNFLEEMKGGEELIYHIKSVTSNSIRLKRQNGWSNGHEKFIRVSP